MPLPTLTVGPITIISLSDGAGATAPADMMPTIPALQWEPLGEYLDADGMFPINYGSYLIREGETWTPVDTGYGTALAALVAPSSPSWSAPRYARMLSSASSSPTCMVITWAATPWMLAASRSRPQERALHRAALGLDLLPADGH